ncbi:hypothetical protein HPB51_027316 [Rhipicephalus microplus]|uniref:Uncharacterized protein n=1 Tax=Rhipicephalus microplus TaxID=6941 RepID=A0A9J6D0J3_RHIMP|nr:hypothetical protein HPB51_027316 [Rhipicephalus microplus]
MDTHSSNPFLFFVQTVLAITLIPSSGDTRVNRTGPDATERILDWHIDTQRDNAADLDMCICTAPFGRLLAPLSSTSTCASGIRTVAVADWASGHGGGTMDTHSSNPFLFFVQESGAHAAKRRAEEISHVETADLSKPLEKKVENMLGELTKAPMRGEFPDGSLWNAALLSSDSQLQARLIRQAEDVARAHEIMAVV